MSPLSTTASAIESYLANLPFSADAFQIEALRAISDGHSVVVTAPTGAGKTVIAEGAIAGTIADGKRAFYTTPIKALSNQKFSDLVLEYGEDAVGLLTGDNVVNGDAPIIVMTTEVLRNMIYERSTALDELGIVILDEVHYLADRHRGSVWEEVIIHLPAPIPIVCLSATIANPEDFTGWVRARRGDTDLIVEHTRPVPLTTMYMWRDRYEGGSSVMAPMFVSGGRPNPGLVRLTSSGKNRHRRLSTPQRTSVVEHLQAEGLLPAIYFVFSRKGCDQLAGQIANSGLSLTDQAEREQIRKVVARRTAHLDPQDLAVLGFETWQSVVERGAAAHHAGLVPAFKETVEELFLRGLVKVVAATETLALGINMPARTVVLDSLSKFTGDGHEFLQPSDFTQLTGRAGRRGIDTAGTAVVLYSPYVPFHRTTGIAGAGANALTSSFAPTYNMTANLIARYDQATAMDLLSASFANYADGSRKGKLVENLEERQRDVATFRGAAECARGDIWEFYDGSRRPSGLELDRQALQPGAVLEFGGQRFVLANRSWGGGQPRIDLVDERARRSTIRSRDLPMGATKVGSLGLPSPVKVSDGHWRAEVVDAMESFVPDSEPAPIFGDADETGVGTCPDLDKHVAWADRARRAQRDVERIERRIARTGRDDLRERFEALRSVLTDMGYINAWTLTDRGDSLKRLYNELDLLLAETLTDGLLDDLDPAEFAAAVSLFTFETRGGEVPPLPHASFALHLIAQLDEIAQRILAVEDRHGLDEQRIPDPGLVDVIHGWASGHGLDDIFDDDDVRAGDFVRAARQVLDLLRQIRDGYGTYREVAAAAIVAVDRGIVATGGIG
jgi:ATP-dependent RNA helicase HelY